MKLNNLTIAPKLGILLGITLLGLSAAGVLAGYLMRQEMLNAKTEQMHASSTRHAAWRSRCRRTSTPASSPRSRPSREWADRANSMTYNNGDGYLFGSTMDGVTVLAPDRKTIGQSRLDVATGGRYIGREWRDGVAAKGEHTLYYSISGLDRTAPVQDRLCGRDPRLEHVCRHRRLSRRRRRQARPIGWMLGLAILGIGIIAGSFAWLIGRSISKPLGLLGLRMKALADGKLEGEIPGVGRGDEVGEMAATVQIFKDNAVRMRELEKSEADTQARAASERRSAMENLAGDFERSVNGIVRTVSSAAAGMQSTAQSMTSTASDASARAATVGAASQSASNNVGTVAAAAEELSSSVTEISRQVARSARSRARRSAMPSAPTPPCRCSPPEPRRSARW